MCQCDSRAEEKNQRDPGGAAKLKKILKTGKRAVADFWSGHSELQGSLLVGCIMSRLVRFLRWIREPGTAGSSQSM